MPYTSANGYMFSLLNKDRELGIRFTSEVQKKYLHEMDTTHFKSYGAIMKGYILIPERLWDDPGTWTWYKPPRATLPGKGKPNPKMPLSSRHLDGVNSD